jgi:hypothetical protein
MTRVAVVFFRRTDMDILAVRPYLRRQTDWRTAFVLD